MEPTVINPDAAKPKAAETGVQEGLPPPGPAPEPAPTPKRQAKHPLYRALEILADLRLTVALFSLAICIVFWGTLAQVDNGVWTVVQKYFRSFIVLVPLKVVLFNANISNDLNIPIPFPGGWLIGSVMLANLLAAHAIRFKLTWNRSGILLIHAGLIVMMLGELVTGLYAVEGQMVIQVGKTENTVIHPGQSELAIIRTVDDQKDEVVTVPARLLKNGNTVENESLPFKIEVVEYMVNSKLVEAPAKNKDMKGFGRVHVAHAEPEVSGVDPKQRFDQPSAYVKLFRKDGKSLGTWLFSAHFTDPQWIEVDGEKTKYQVSLRFKHKTRGFSLHLKEFKHDVFPGTNTPKDFHSYIRLTDPEKNLDRDVEIYMNAPLYYNGETYYQSSWTTDFAGRANGTILQVVRNPGWLLPYISCFIVGIGMLFHFGLTLYRFVDRRVVR